MMREGFPEVTETIDHVEYADLKKLETNIPPCKFEYVNGKPMALHFEGRKYEVRTKDEKTNSTEFFKSEIEYSPEGVVRSIKFDNIDARDYFAAIYYNYRNRLTSRLGKDMTDDLRMERYDQAGGYSETHKELLDDLQVRIRKKAVKEGKTPDYSPTGMLDATSSLSYYYSRHKCFIRQT